MSDRFYQQMREATGWCPGMPESMKNKRRRRVAWTDEAKAQAVEMYTAEDPTPENSMEIVKEIAAELGESPNGVRMILTKAGVLSLIHISEPTRLLSIGYGRVWV